METWTLKVSPVSGFGGFCALLFKPGRASPVYEASRSQRDRAICACLNGAGVDWVHGTWDAKINGRTIKIEAEFPLPTPTTLFP